MSLNTITSLFRSVLSTSSAPHLRFAVSSARINKASRTTSKVIGIATRKANGISWFGSNRAGYLFSSWSAEGDGPANNAKERFIMLKFLFKLVEMNMSPKVFVLLRRKVPMSQNMHVYKAAPLTLRGFTCNKMIKRLTTLFKHVGRFPFNPKFRKFRLVHQMERTISVYSDRNIRYQLWMWFTLTGPLISVGRTEMSLSIWQNCCPQYRSFVSCLQEQ